MSKSLLTTLLLSFFILGVFFGLSKSVYANATGQGTDTGFTDSGYCDLSGSIGSSNPAPYPRHIICPLIRIINVALLVAGVGLAIFIGFGAIKLSASLGDPKAYEGSVKTFTYAIIGFFIVVGSFALLFILDRTLDLGLGFGSPADLANRISSWWDEFLCNKLWIVQPGSGCDMTWTGPSIN